MQTKAKVNSIITHERLESGSIRFHVKGAGHVDFDKTKAHQDNRLYAEDHGWIQRVSDGAAMQRNPETGLPATPQDKLARMVAIVEHYESGSADWRRSGGDGGGKSITIQAIAELKSITYAEAEAHVTAYAERNYEGDRKETLEFLRGGARVQEQIALIRKRAERPASVDADAQLDQLIKGE